MKHSEIKALRKFVGGTPQKGGSALGLSPMTESKRGGLRHRLTIGGDSYGC